MSIYSVPAYTICLTAWLAFRIGGIEEDLNVLSILQDEDCVDGC